MHTNLLFSALAIAGLSVLWRNWIAQHPKAESSIKKSLRAYSPVLLCGSCLTYWLALGMVLFHNPVQPWVDTFILGGGWSFFMFRIFVSWMIVAYISVLLRFSYVLIQERVNELVHHHAHMHDDHK